MLDEVLATEVHEALAVLEAQVDPRHSYVLNDRGVCVTTPSVWLAKKPWSRTPSPWTRKRRY
jgi:hypothetical protein